MTKALRDVFDPALFKALCDPTRITLVSELAKRGEATVSDIAEVCPCDLSVVSRHLAALRDAGVIESEKRGRYVFYRLPAQRLAATLRAMADAVDDICS